MKRSFIEKNIYSFLNTYLQLQHTITIDRFIDIEDIRICYSQIDPSPYWNFALIDTDISESTSQAIELTFHTLHRSATLYMANTASHRPLQAKLEKRGYQKTFEDSWQFWSDHEIDTRHFSSLKKVSSEKELEIFLDVFDRCYQHNDPQNPYGRLGAYLDTAREAWMRHPSIREDLIFSCLQRAYTGECCISHKLRRNRIYFKCRISARSTWSGIWKSCHTCRRTNIPTIWESYTLSSDGEGDIST